MHSADLSRNYVEIQNLRFANNTGSSLSETIVLTQIPVVFNFATILLLNLNTFTPSYPYRMFAFEYIGTVLTCVLFLTVYSSFVFSLYLFSYFLVILIIIGICYRRNVKRAWILRQRERIVDDRLPCITHFRGFVNIYSVICILAADFTCFPQRFLKTESYGFGLMDTGVGLFVVAYSFSSSHLSRRSSQTSVIRQVLPLLVVGAGRFISTSAVNYQYQISEYGTQWNFFITLSVLTFVNKLIFKFLRSIKTVFSAAVVLLVIHEFILIAGVKEWILSDAPRTNFISGNREGIFSLLGYEVIYLFGVVIRNYLPTKDETYRRYWSILPVYTVAFFVSMVLTKSAEFMFGVSRRTANSGYVFWIISITCISMIELVLLELFMYCVFSSKRTFRVEVVPQIVKSVNFNGFTFFLVGNLLTGFINLSIGTLTLSDISGVIIISLYMLCCCSVNMFLYRKQLRLRWINILP